MAKNAGIDRREFLIGSAAGAALIGCGGNASTTGADATDTIHTSDTPPIGTGSPRVAWVPRAGATSWNYSSGYFYDHVDQGAVDALMDAAVIGATGAATAAAGWSQVMASYQTGDLVAIKINT